MTLIARIFCLFGFAAIFGTAHAFPTADYLPLAHGNSWTGTKDGVVITDTVMPNPVLINGISATAVQENNGDTTYTTNDANGIREIGYFIQSVPIPNYGVTSSTVTLNPPFIDLPADATLGQAVSSSGTATLTYTGIGTYTLNYTGQSTPIAFETVTVPAGTFNALKVQQQLTLSATINGQAFNSSTTQTVWGVPKVGLVKRDSSETINGVTTNHSYVLNSYNVFIPVTTPNPFSFAPKTGVVPGALAMSTQVAVTGINVHSPISITGGEYSINGLAYTSASGTVNANDWVAVRLMAPMGFGATASAVLNIGGVSASFDVTTMQSIPTGNVLYYSSQAGDYIGQGITDILSSSNQYSITSGVTFLESFSVTGVTNSWTLSLRSPGNTPLTAGSYVNAQRAAFAPAGVPGLDFYGNGRGCSTVSGRFDVLEAVHDATGNIQKFAVNFEQHCEGGAPALFGQLRYNSTIPVDMTLISAYGAGWNLSGNARNSPVDVASVFGDAAKVTTAWKWIPATSKWAFYAPSMTAPNLATYAASKGYDVLTTVNGGEGFWVNAKAAFTAQLPAGTAIGTSYFQDQTDPAQNKLLKGWNLIATGDNVTPSLFNQGLSVTPPAQGVIPLNVTTLWAWDNIQSKWYFYAPSLEANGTLATYFTSKSYLDFTPASKTLGQGVGFWVNRP